VVESDASAVGVLLRMLNLYKLRSKVKIAQAEYTVINDALLYLNFDVILC
jgi:folate-binding Fe-S cluster repair protein YgfZ